MPFIARHTARPAARSRAAHEGRWALIRQGVRDLLAAWSGAAGGLNDRMDQPISPPDRWVFGYGSLMWRPGFRSVERRRARLEGLRRAFCIYSVHHRGTPERRGLVLGLAEGGEVLGAAYRIDESDWPGVYDYLREREQPTETYVEARAAVALDDGRTVDALIFLSDIHHPQWAGVLDLGVQAQMIAGAEGLSGRNVDYLRDLVAHLRQEAADDEDMERLLIEVERLEAPA